MDEWRKIGKKASEKYKSNSYGDYPSQAYWKNSTE